MKTSKRLLLPIMVLLFSTSVLAQTSSTVTVGSGGGGAGDVVEISVDFTAGDNDIAGIDMDVTFNDALYSSVTVPGNCGATVGAFINSCSITGNTLSISIAGTSAFPDGILALVTFTIDDPSTPGDDPLDGTVISLSDPQAGAPDPSTVPVTDGILTIAAGPQPDYSSAPTPAQGVQMNVIQNNPDPSMDILISNVGEVGSTLDVACQKTEDAGNVFTILNSDFAVDQGAAAQAVTVTCDATESIQNHTAVLTCDHNGDGQTEADPAVYAMSCNITEGPQAAYGDLLSPSPLDLVADEEGDANPTGTITVTNTGDPDTTLTGECSYVGDAGMSLSAGVFSLAKDASMVATLTCDASAEGSFNGTITCADGENIYASHAVSCEVGPPGPAVYLSDPVPGSTINMTDADVPVGASVPDKVLTITNDAAELNDRDLGLECAFSSGDPAITAESVSMLLPPQESKVVTFSCDTSEPGDYTATYLCEYDLGLEGGVGAASYTVNCGVREAESELSESPPSGTLLSIVVPIGGTGQTSVSFTEILDEGEDATIDECYFDDGDYFNVVTSLPANVDSGETVVVTLQGTDPGDGSTSVSDTLYCYYTDSNTDRGQEGDVSWPITLSIQTAAIPTLSVWGLALMILTMLGLGGIVIRRRVFS